MTAVVLEVENLSTRFATPDGEVLAADEVGFTIGAGESLGVVGESGSGKTQIFLSIMGLLAKNGRSEGSVRYRGKEILNLPARGLNQIRGDDLAMIFQDPMTSLNPFLKISRQLTEVMREHKGVGDEPTTALDVTVQAQILELLGRLKRELGMAIALITHDLGVVAGLCERVMVMYAGRAVETAPAGDLFRDPQHPYSKGLLLSMPRLDEKVSTELVTIPGQPPNLQALPRGCVFADRCPYVFERCRVERPHLVPYGPLHAKACHLERLQ